MIFPNPPVVTSLRIFETDFQESEMLLVPARPFHSLTFRYGGRITVEAGGELLTSEADCITYVPAGMAYRSQILERGHMTVAHFEVSGSSPSVAPMVFKSQNPQVFSSLFAALEEAYTGNPGEYFCMALFYEILGTMEKEGTARLSGASRRMEAARSFIERSYGSRELSVKLLAEMAGISEVYFRKEFRQHFGMAPLAFIRLVRLRNAKTLLKTGYYSVTETAEKCGFDSLSYFCSEFHRATGTSPGAYLKRYTG